MKRIGLIITLILAFALTKAQDIYLTSGFSQEDQAIIQKAKADIQRADRLYQKSLQIYNQYRPLLESPKKGKRRRGERKSISGKITLKQAAYYYDKGYNALFTVYFNHCKNLNFQLPENRNKARSLLRQAEASFNNGQSQLKRLQNYSEKDLKKRVTFKSLVRTVDEGKDYELKAITRLIQIINLFNSETEQIQQKRQKDEQAWQQALYENTIEAYQNYIDNFPDGKHVAEAQAKITALQQQQEQNVDTTILDYTKNPTFDLIYRVQILSDIKPWTPGKIRAKIYRYYGRDGKPTYNAFIDGRYKYFIGEFKTYNEAKQVAESLRITVKTKPFVVAFLNGEPIDIKRAISIEQQMQR